MKKGILLLATLFSCAILYSGSAIASSPDLSIAVDSDVDTLHPANYSSTVESDVLNQIYDCLIYMNPDEQHDPEPRIAESWEISDDGLEYTFYLRDDVKFHDGTPLTADDVVFSFDLYQNEEMTQTGQVDGLDYTEAVDDYTVICHLQHAYSPFLLGVSEVHIASRASYDSDENAFATTPNGSGPYKYVSRTEGASLSLTAFEDYYRGEPSIKNITFEVIPDATTTAMGLQSGEVDFAKIEPATKAQLEASGLTIQEVQTSAFAYVSMNMEKEPYNNVAFRQAINYAINRENFVEIIYEGYAEPNSNICSKTRFGYSEDQPQYDYDPEKAAELLKEAGIECSKDNPYDLGTLLVASTHANMAEVIQADLANVGLHVDIEQQEFNTWIGNLSSGNYEISVLTLTLEGDTQQLEYAFCTQYINMANNARYSDEEMDSLWEQAAEETDKEKRAEIFDEIFTKAQNEAIYAPICNPLDLYASAENLDTGELPFEGLYSVYNFKWNE